MSIAAARLRERRDQIIAAWLAADREVCDAHQLDDEERIDNLPLLLEELAERLSGRRPAQAAAVEHARQRLVHGFALREVVREYSLLRRVLIHALDGVGIAGLTEVHDHLDEAIAVSAHAWADAAADQLQRLNRRYETALAGSHVAFFEQDAQLRYTWVKNPQLHRPPEAFLGRTDEEMFAGAPDLGAMVALKRRVLATGQSARAEFRLAAGDRGGTFSFHVEPERDASGEVCGILCAASDVSRRAQAEEEARNALHLRDLFVGVVSHDLRNPLSVIALALSRVLASPNLSEPERRLVTRAQAAAARCRRLINDLLDSTRAHQTGTLPVEKRRIRLDEVARAVVPDAAAAHPGRVVELDAVPVEGNWDPDRMGQLMDNLVANALRHGASDAPVVVRVSADAGEACVCVNNGVPIDPTLLPVIFEPFRHGPGALNVGLGLYIAREIVRAHGGRIEVESNMQEGTRFRALLPLDA